MIPATPRIPWTQGAQRDQFHEWNLAIASQILEELGLEPQQDFRVSGRNLLQWQPSAAFVSIFTSKLGLVESMRCSSCSRIYTHDSIVLTLEDIPSGGKFKIKWNHVRADEPEEVDLFFSFACRQSRSNPLVSSLSFRHRIRAPDGVTVRAP